MSDVSIFIKGQPKSGKTWLAVNLKTYLEQLGFQVSSITEGKGTDVITVRDPVPVITQVAQGRRLRPEDRQGGLPVGIVRISKDQVKVGPGPMVVRLPGTLHSVEVKGTLDFGTEEKPAPTIDSVTLKVPEGFTWPEESLSDIVHSAYTFNEQCLLTPTPEPHPDYITVTHGIRGFFAVRMQWSNHFGGFYEPWQASSVSHGLRADAVIDAQEWAAEEGVAYK